MPARAIAAPRLVDFGPLPEPVQAAFDAALSALERDMGLSIEPIQPSEIFRAGNPSEDWLLLCALEHVHHFGWEFCEANLERFSPVFRDVVEYARKRPLEEYMVARRRRFEYVRELDLLLGDDAVLLTPTNCFQTMPPDGVGDDSTGRTGEGPDSYNTDPQNVTGHPAISVPAGLCPRASRSGCRSPRPGSATTWRCPSPRRGSGRTRGRSSPPATNRSPSESDRVIPFRRRDQRQPFTTIPATW